VTTLLLWLEALHAGMAPSRYARISLRHGELTTRAQTIAPDDEQLACGYVSGRYIVKADLTAQSTDSEPID
jgi:hypothetical protein